MTSTTTATSGWHSNGHLGEVLAGYRTAHRPPAVNGPWWLYGLLDLPRPALRRYLAVHEAAHAVLGQAHGLPLDEVALADDLGQGPGEGPAGHTTWGFPLQCAWIDWATTCAAGEQAQQRWLREQDLHTETRGWAIEIQGQHDRRSAVDALRTAEPVTVSFGAPGTAAIDWQTLREYADVRLDRRWPQVLAVAAALDQAGRLTGEQARGHLRPIPSL